MVIVCYIRGKHGNFENMMDKFTGFVIELLVRSFKDAGRDMSDMKESVLDTKEKLLKRCI